MSFISDLFSILQKYNDAESTIDINEDCAKAAKRCLKMLRRIIKKEPKVKKPEQPQKISYMQQKKLEEKQFVINRELTQVVTFRKKCYICHANTPISHEFYNSMCIECGNFNFEMRNRMKDLTGSTAIVTGGRIKIGYEIALWLLRNNCTVIVTTRFPADALLRFQKEKDYSNFKDRLFLYGLDFKDLKKVYQFVDYIYDNFKEINILINNAAQTLYRSDDYNKQLMQDEETALKAIQAEGEKAKIDIETCIIHKNENLSTNDVTIFKNYTVYDVNHIPVDFSSKNSWTKEIEEIGFIEFAEAQVINSWVPFILRSRLKTIMTVPNKNSYIVNVSAMEGKFDYFGKSSKHPHTNMTKAALNMLTRTCGESFAKVNIFMTSVDTGWCSEMNPHLMYSNKRTVPLDEFDGVMRVLHPIFDELKIHSVLLKNYKVTTW